MKLATLQHKSGTGWSVKDFPQLDSANTVLFIFGAPEFLGNKSPFEDLEKAYPLAVKVGCSTAGEIFGSHIFDGSLSVAIARFEKGKVRAVTLGIEQVEKSFDVGKELALQLKQPDLQSLFILSDGLRVNGSELLRGVNSVVTPGTPVTGGLAADGPRFKETWVLKNGRPAAGCITVLGLFGKEIQLGHGSQGGWDIFGPERIVTRSEGNILYELDGKPALDIYKEYLGEKASGLPATGLLFPLQIRSSVEDKKRLVRTVLAVNEDTKAMVFAGDIPTGYFAQLMRANFDRLIDGASTAAKLVAPSAHQDILTIAISCVGRRLVLGERSEEEVEAVVEGLPKGAKQIGFYSYGEISPFVSGQSCELHNQTMTITTISEETGSS